MALLRIELTDRSADDEGNLTEEYTVEAEASENVETIKTAYLIKSQVRLPQIGDVNTLRKEAGGDLAKKLSYVDKVRAKHSGKDWNTYKVTVTYVPPSSGSNKDKTQGEGTEYPWNDPTDISQTGDVAMEALQGVDKRGNSLRYSNNDLIAQEAPTPLTNITIVRKPLRSKRNSFSLSSEFYQTINSGPETIYGTKYEPRTLLVQAFDVGLERFKQVDDKTGKVTITDYQVESIVITHNKATWDSKIVDEGVVALEEQEDPNNPGTTKLVQVPEQNIYTGQIVLKKSPLNGQGRRIFDEELAVVNSPKTSGETIHGVPIDNLLSIGGGDRAQTILDIAIYEAKSFSGLNLNEGL
jgi:hypothetical protein